MSRQDYRSRTQPERPNRPSRSQASNQRKQKPKKRWTWKKTWWLLFFTTTFAIFCAVGGYLFILLNGERLMNEYKEKDMFQLAVASTIYDRKGVELGKIGAAESNREIAEPGGIPKKVEDAFVATEDRRFYEHAGVDLWSIGRAMVKDVMAGGLVEGGSTITQQLAKNMFLSSDKTFFRKATEMSIALAIENHHTKDEILTMYLNRIYFGSGAYGIKSAAYTYFGVKDLNDLEVWQMATLAAIPKAPSHYSPLLNPERSKERRNVVLSLMREQGYITDQEFEEAKKVEYDPSLAPSKKEGGSSGTTAYQSFIDYMMEEVEERTGFTEDQLRRGGYQIYTTMDSQAQKAMFEEYQNADNFEKSNTDVLSQSAMVITDHSNGAIVAMMGGRDYAVKGLNRVTVKRQPGSSFKPIVSYAPAIESGEYFPWSTLRDDKQCFGNYCPTDLGSNKYVGAIEMTEAVKRSTNLPAVWLLNEIGLKNGFEFAKNMGIHFEDEDYNLSIALGGLTKGATPIEMAEAYNAFANGGIHYDSYSIKKIDDRNGKQVYSYKPEKAKRVMKEQTAYYMTQMMEEVVRSGTGRAAQMDRPVAGKTGSTQHSIPGYNGPGSRDFWFVGYTPQWTAAVWMGYDKTDKDHVMKGSSGQPAALFSKIMAKAMSGMDKGSFGKPGNVEEKPTPELPSAIEGLAASYSENTKTISLSWNAIEGENVKYHIYRKSAEEQQYTKILADLSVLNAEDIGVFPGQTYTYYVTATSDDNPGEFGKSGEVAVTIPADETVEPPIDPTEPPIDPTDPSEPGGEVTPPDGGTGNNGGQEPGAGSGEGTDNGNAGNNGNSGNNGNGNGNQNGNGSSESNGNGTSDPNDGSNSSDPATEVDGGQQTETPAA